MFNKNNKAKRAQFKFDDRDQVLWQIPVRSARLKYRNGCVLLDDEEMRLGISSSAHSPSFHPRDTN